MLALEQVFILFLLIIVGYVVKKRGIVTDNINREVSSLVLNVLLPAFLIKSMNFSFNIKVLIQSGTLVAISFSIYAVVIALSYLATYLLKEKDMRKDIFQYILAFSNCGYMGYPVIDAILGSEGVFLAAIYNISFSVLVWTYGVFLMRRTPDRLKGRHTKSSWRQKIKGALNPGLIAVLLGFMLFLFSIELPYPIFRSLELLGNTASPLSMMFIGFILAEVPIKEVYTDANAFIISLVRLIAYPFIVFIGLKLLGFNGYLLQIPVLITAMPAAANTAILASRYENDVRLGSKVIFISTLISITTIPLVVLFI